MKSRTSRLKPSSFVPKVARVGSEDASEVPGFEEAVRHWSGGASVGDWMRGVYEDWGNVGLSLSRGDEVLGFLLYGPKEYLERAAEYPVGPLDKEAALLACVEGDQRTSRRLLVRMLRELRERGTGRVEAIASDVGVRRHVPTALLLQSGWKPVSRGWYRGTPYTLADLDLRNAVEAGELARGLLGRVRLPGLSGGPIPGVVSGNSGETRANSRSSSRSREKSVKAPATGH